MHYRAPVKPCWRLGILRTPATFKGGARDVKIRFTYSHTSGGDPWVEITATNDPHYKRGERFYCSDALIYDRD